MLTLQNKDTIIDILKAVEVDVSPSVNNLLARHAISRSALTLLIGQLLVDRRRHSDALNKSRARNLKKHAGKNHQKPIF